MVQERKNANAIEDIRDRSIAYDEKVKSYFEPIRYHVDKLELLVEDAFGRCRSLGSCCLLSKLFADQL